MNLKRMLFLSLTICFFSITLIGQTIKPQTPIEPFTYNVENVSFINKADSAILAGTLTTPKGKGPFQAVILITGSGSQNRDEEILGHKPFLVIADYLTRNGIAVLRFDDRGVGESNRGRGDITTQSNARDVLAAINFLKTRKEINKHKIGLIGHSEGGIIAFMLASTQKDVSFIVSLAGSGVGGDKILLSQQEIYFKAMGTPDKIVEISINSNKECFEMIKASSSNNGEFKEKVINWFREKSPDITQQQIDAQIKSILSPWMYDFIKYDPYNDIKNTKVPALVIIGKKDTQVISSINLPAIESALKEGGNSKYKIIEPEDLNHLFQHCKTGLPGEYSELEETFSPAILDIITAWILKQ